MQHRVCCDVKWKASGARQGLAPVGADCRRRSVRSWILCLVSLKHRGLSCLQHKGTQSTKETGRVSWAVLAVLVRYVSLFCWHFLDRCCSLNSLGRFLWSQCSSCHVQSLWSVATFHTGKHTIGAVCPEDARPARSGGSWGPGSQCPMAIDDRGRPLTEALLGPFIRPDHPRCFQ